MLQSPVDLDPASQTSKWKAFQPDRERCFRCSDSAELEIDQARGTDQAVLEARFQDGKMDESLPSQPTQTGTTTPIAIRDILVDSTFERSHQDYTTPLRQH